MVTFKPGYSTIIFIILAEMKFELCFPLNSLLILNYAKSANTQDREYQGTPLSKLKYYVFFTALYCILTMWHTHFFRWLVCPKCLITSCFTNFYPP